MQTAPLTPERRLTPVLDVLLTAMDRRRFDSQNTWLPLALLYSIYKRIAVGRARVYRLIERIRAGEFRPRKPAAPRPAAPQSVQPTENPPQKPKRQPPKTHSMLRKSGWMNRLMPGPESGHCHRALQNLFADPEMAPILAAAPQAIWREVRSFYWMFGLKRPAILAPPPRPRKPKATKPPKRPKTRRRQSPQAPAPAVQGPWPRIPSAQWPPGVMDRRRKTT